MLRSRSDSVRLQKIGQKSLFNLRPVANLDYKSLQANVHTPPSFRDDIPLKVFTHGFQDRTKPNPVAGETGERGAKFIKSWQDYHKTGFWGDGSDVGVMLINWSFWARGPPPPDTTQQLATA